MAVIDFSAGRVDVKFHAADAHVVSADWSVDLTGYTVVSTLRSCITGEVVATLTTEKTDAAAGKVQVTFPAGITPGTYTWQQRWSSEDDSQTGFCGFVEVLP